MRYIGHAGLTGEVFGAAMTHYAALYAMAHENNLTPVVFKNEDRPDFKGFNRWPQSLTLEQTFPNFDKEFHKINYDDHEWDTIEGPYTIITLPDDALHRCHSPMQMNHKYIAPCTKNVNITGLGPNFAYWIRQHAIKISNLFSFNLDLVDICKNHYPYMGKPTVGISLRTEYNRKDAKHNHFGLGPTYFLNAIREFDPEVLGYDVDYLIFSDDMKLADQILKIKQPFLNFGEISCLDLIQRQNGRVVFIGDLPSAHGMCMFSLCDHMILSNSCFSWWAAFLNKNIHGPITDEKYNVPVTGSLFKETTGAGEWGIDSTKKIVASVPYISSNNQNNFINGYWAIPQWRILDNEKCSTSFKL